MQDDSCGKPSKCDTCEKEFIQLGSLTKQNWLAQLREQRNINQAFHLPFTLCKYWGWESVVSLTTDHWVNYNDELLMIKKPKMQAQKFEQTRHVVTSVNQYLPALASVNECLSALAPIIECLRLLAFISICFRAFSPYQN